MNEADQSTPALELTGISAGYNGRTILRKLTLSIRAGESVALIGPNGCGKSTLFRVVVGLVRCMGGTVKLHGKSLGELQPDERIRLGLGYLKQTNNVFTGLTVEDNLALAGASVEAVNGGNGCLRRVLDAFPALANCRGKRSGLLSGGQRQSLAIAMVLMRPPQVLLLDEPVAGLSPAAGKALLDALKRLRNDDGFATIIIEHRLRQVQPHVDRVLVMREGEIVDDIPDPARMLDANWLATHYTNGNRVP